jgi:hypothetical protein
VQLAVIAHIRHTHTRYDLLLRETSWEQARKTVESLCLDILVKWRGDEETGRDQLDEVLREIVVLDDSEDEDGEDSDEEDETEGDSDEVEIIEIADGPNPAITEISKDLLSGQQLSEASQNQNSNEQSSSNLEPVTDTEPPSKELGIASRTRSKTKPKNRHSARKARRGIKRYQAWQEALTRRQERPAGPQTPLEQDSRREFRAMSRPVEQNASNYFAGSPNIEYQAIYAIEDGRLLRPRRPVRSYSPYFRNTVVSLFLRVY